MKIRPPITQKFHYPIDIIPETTWIPATSISRFFWFIVEAENKKTSEERELAHVENKLEQFIVILRDIFEFVFVRLQKARWKGNSRKNIILAKNEIWKMFATVFAFVSTANSTERQ